MDFAHNQISKLLGKVPVPKVNMAFLKTMSDSYLKSIAKETIDDWYGIYGYHKIISNHGQSRLEAFY